MRRIAFIAVSAIVLMFGGNNVFAQGKYGADSAECIKYLSYYKEYFKSDDEIHAIVNFNYKTTTKISVMGNLLDVSVYEYVDKEEHDAKLLFSGMLLKEYHVNKDTGEIEEIQ